MNIRKVVTKGLLAAAMFAALAIVPMALFSATANADSVNWDAIAQCESGGNWGINSGNGHYGGLQFKQATWSSNGGVGNPATASRAEQIRVAENVLRTQGIKAWPKCGPRGALARRLAQYDRAVDADAPAAPARHRLRRNALRRLVRLHQSAPDVLRAAQPAWALWRRHAEFVALRVDPHAGIGPQRPLPAVGHHTLVVDADEFPDEMLPAGRAVQPARRAVRPVAHLGTDHAGPPRSELLRSVTVGTDREGARRRPIVALGSWNAQNSLPSTSASVTQSRIFAENPAPRSSNGAMSRT